MVDIQSLQVARVVYEERVNEYTLRRRGAPENVFALTFSAIKNALLARNTGRSESAKQVAKSTKLAAR